MCQKMIWYQAEASRASVQDCIQNEGSCVMVKVHWNQRKEAVPIYLGTAADSDMYKYGSMDQGCQNTRVQCRLLPIHLNQEGEGPHLMAHLMLNMKTEINNNTWPDLTTSPLHPLYNGWTKTFVNKHTTVATDPTLFILLSSFHSKYCDSFAWVTETICMHARHKQVIWQEKQRIDCS